MGLAVKEAGEHLTRTVTAVVERNTGLAGLVQAAALKDQGWKALVDRLAETMG